MKHWLVVSEYRNYLYGAQREKAEDWVSSMAVLAEPGARAGDGCILWRPEAGGGVVANGEVTRITVERPVDFPALRAAREREGGDGVQPSRAWADLAFGKLTLSNPVPPSALLDAELGSVVESARLAEKRPEQWDGHLWSREGPTAMPVEMSEAQFHRLTELADHASPPADWPATWNIPPGSIVQRSKLHKVYGGNPRVWAGSSATTPNAFLFLSADRAPELSPRWAAGALLAAGHGQSEDSVSVENLGVLAHLRRGIPLRVFIARGNECLYLGEFVSDLARPVESWLVTGQKSRKYAISDSPIVWDVRTPIFRLRQLSGVTLPADGTELFRVAPRINLALHPSDDQPAATAVRELLVTLEREPSLAAALGGLDEAQVLAALVQRARRRGDLDRLRVAVGDPSTSERSLQKLLEQMTWIFGGEFLAGTGRRRLTVLDQLDLALLRPDGSLHGVELKRSGIRALVKKQHNHWIVSHHVHKAVGQAENYLRELDEARDHILSRLQIDCRRASMTVVIGHRGHDRSGASSQEIDEAIRTYNSHLSRVSVTTYDDLIENAQRMLELAASHTDPSQSFL